MEIIENFVDTRGELKFINKNNSNIKEEFISINHKNVIRGIHCSPYGKIITCLKGKCIDYIINLQDLTHKKYVLSENSKVYVPPNFGHMFVTLEEDTQILYQLEGIYDPIKEINIHYRDPFLNLDIHWGVDYILSEKDTKNRFVKDLDYIILGGNGFIGSYTCRIMDSLNKNYIKLNTRLENVNLLYEQLSTLKPKYVICAAGISGKPTTEWCENNKEETFLVNYTLQLELCTICKKLDIHLTIYGSGLIYNKKGIYNEKDKPNKDDLYYSRVRIMLENELEVRNMFTNILYLRILYPISGDGHEKCFLTKIKNRLNTIHDVKINSTILYDLIPNMFLLIERKTSGVLNFVNPGLISIPELIKSTNKDLDFKIVHTNNINIELDSQKLVSLCPSVSSIYKCMEIICNLNNKFTNNKKMTKRKIWYAPNKLEAYGDEEIDAVTSTLKDGWLAGFGPKTEEFEKKISSYFSKEYGLFVNSGSSANLLALLSLKKLLKLNKDDEVITPACTFSTTLAPIIQTELTPVFCDIGINDYVANINQVISLITEKTKIILLPNLIGNKPDWKYLREYLDSISSSIYLVEDSCDTLTYTPYSDISTASFYSSHLITAGGSGGMVMFNNKELLNIAKMYRDWGRIGDNSEKVEDRFNYEIDDIPYDWKFLYEVIGYNFKSSEMNAAFGLVQFDKLEKFKSIRRQLFERYLDNLKDNSNFILPDDSKKSNWLAIPFLCTKNNRKDVLTYLEKNNVQTRVCFSGNITKHPAFLQYKKDFTNADNVMAKGFLLGCHHGMTLEDVDYVCDLLKKICT